eukprot:12287755-Alexandrium_andersonii.AAC.1
MSASLVGSEMCIRDSLSPSWPRISAGPLGRPKPFSTTSRPHGRGRVPRPGYRAHGDAGMAARRASPAPLR